MITTIPREVLDVNWQEKNLPYFCTESELDEELPLSDVIATNGMVTVFCIFDQYMHDEPEITNLRRKFAVWCARKAEHLMGDASRAALDMAWLHSEGRATDEDLAYSANLSRDEYKAAHKDLHNKDLYNSFIPTALDPHRVHKVWLASCAAEAVSSRHPSMMAGLYAAWATSSHPLNYNPKMEKKQAAKLKQILDSGKWVED